MTLPNDPTRRALMASVAGLSLGSTANAESPTPVARSTQRSSILVVFFSRTGNTRVVAGLIQRATGAQMFEIVPASAYPVDYLATVEQARVERDNGIRPAMAANIQGMGGFKTVYLGFPIWGETAPPLIRTLLSSQDMAGKTIIPFITHGGYGLGNSEAVLAQHAPKARLVKAFSMQADQERQTMDRVNGWLQQVPALR